MIASVFEALGELLPLLIELIAGSATPGDEPKSRGADRVSIGGARAGVLTVTASGALVRIPRRGLRLVDAPSGDAGSLVSRTGHGEVRRT